MSNQRFCPECGHQLAEDEKFCPDCGTDVSSRDDASRRAVAPSTPDDGGPIVGAGARANVTGGIHNATTRQTHVDNSHVDNSTAETHVNTSTVDNSQTVHNTTIVMDSKPKAEYCAVCGNPLGERHARCPKCGRDICFDCKVKGKNRCIECEKKALNDYRAAVQQMLLLAGGIMDGGTRQMLDQKARDLDVTDAKTTIEREVADALRPTKARPEASPQPSPEGVGPLPNPPLKGRASRDATNFPAPFPLGEGRGEASGEASGRGEAPAAKATPRVPLAPKHGDSSGKGKGIAIIAVLIIGIVAYFLLARKETPVPREPAAETMTPAVEAAPQPSPKEENVKPSPTPSVESGTSGAATPAPTPAPTDEEREETSSPSDAQYDAGMKAYADGDGTTALRCFKASGSAKSYYMIGLIYESGCGKVAANAMMARKNFKTAADMGSKEAKSKL